MVRNSLVGINETGEVAQWAQFPLKVHVPAFLLGMLKSRQCMPAGYTSATLRLGEILPMYDPMLLPTKPVKITAATHACS